MFLYVVSYKYKNKTGKKQAMKKKLCKIIGFILAFAMPFTASCGEKKSGSPVEPETPPSIDAPENSDNEHPSGDDEGGDGEGGQTGETLYFPEYEPDVEPLEKIPTQFPRIASASNFRVALDADGKAWAWGTNEWGELGNGERTTPERDATEFAPRAVETSARFVSVSAGLKQVLAVDTNGKLWGWGYVRKPRIDSSVGSSMETTPIPLLAEWNFTYAEAGDDCSFAIDTLGYLWGWGNNLGGMGDGSPKNSPTPTPAQIMPGKKFAQVSTSGSQTYAIEENGNLWGWGRIKRDNSATERKKTNSCPRKSCRGSILRLRAPRL